MVLLNNEQLFILKRYQELVKIDTICFDGIFYSCPEQFMQLWTIFGIFQQHTLPELYKIVMMKIQIVLPQISPKFPMSDWEKAARNAIKGCLNNINLSGCMFHYNQKLWIISRRTAPTWSSV